MWCRPPNYRLWPWMDLFILMVFPLMILSVFIGFIGAFFWFPMLIVVALLLIMLPIVRESFSNVYLPGYVFGLLVALFTLEEMYRSRRPDTFGEYLYGARQSNYHEVMFYLFLVMVVYFSYYLSVMFIKRRMNWSVPGVDV